MSSTPYTRPAFPLLDRFRISFFALSLAAVLAACGDSTAPDEAVSAVLVAEPYVFLNDSITVTAVAEYQSGPRVPETVAWGVSDSSVLDLSVVALGEVSVKGIGRGTAYVIAIVNTEFPDTAEVIVGIDGDVYWVAEVPAYSHAGPAMDAQGRVYGVTAGIVGAVSPTGEILYTVDSCPWAELSGSVLPDGTAFSNGSSCVQRTASDGSVDWQFLDGGSRKGGVAVTPSGAVTFLDGETLFRLSPTGTELWRTRIAVSAWSDQDKAPAVAANGDTYIPWDSSGANSRLSRVANDGTLLWTVVTTDGVNFASPALADNRIVLSYGPGAVAVFDTTGTLLWEDSWGANQTSSPVLDGAGNIYVQSRTALVSYDASGTQRWSADSLRSGAPWGIAAPTLLSSGQLVVECVDQGDTYGEVCAVNTADGSMVWRSDTGLSLRGAPAVDSDGFIHMQSSDGIVALFGRTPPLATGWPTEGGDMGRTRSR